MYRIHSFFRLEIIILFFIILLGVGLRSYHLSTDPLGLYIDEASIGYNASTILHSGKDEYGQPFPMAFRAFGEYKMPVYIYLTSAAMIPFGTTDFAVRFPSFFFGSISILVFYFLVEQIIFLDQHFLPQKGKTIFCLCTTFLFAVLPWNVMFSRVGFEANVGLFFYLTACFFFLKTLSSKHLLSVTICFFALVASIYTYDAFRIIAPITLFCFSVYLYKKLPSQKKNILILLLAAILGVLPMALFSFTNGGVARFAETSAFSQYAQLPLLKKFFVYPLVYLQNYISYFSLSYLFSFGDGFDRQRVLGFGPVLRAELPFFLIGTYFFLKKSRGFLKIFILFLLFIAPIAGAFTIPSPHELRSFLLVIPLTILAGLGATQLFLLKGKSAKVILTALVIIFAYNLISFYDVYFVEYPFDSIISWGGGYQQLVSEATRLQSHYKYIVVSGSDFGGINYIYFKFYNQHLPYIVGQKNIVWEKPISDKNAKVLYISANPKDKQLQTMHHTFIENISLPNLNHDTFATFYQL